jgi:hypothetical protein
MPPAESQSLSWRGLQLPTGLTVESAERAERLLAKSQEQAFGLEGGKTLTYPELVVEIYGIMEQTHQAGAA